MGSFVGCRCLQENKPEGASGRLGTDPCTLIHEVLFVFKAFFVKELLLFFTCTVLRVLCCETKCIGEQYGERPRILAYMAFCEVSQDQSPGTPAAAGDFGFKVLTSSDPAEKTKKLSAELANGRLAMMAIIGMFFQAPCHMKALCA